MCSCCCCVPVSFLGSPTLLHHTPLFLCCVCSDPVTPYASHSRSLCWRPLVPICCVRVSIPWCCVLPLVCPAVHFRLTFKELRQLVLRITVGLTPTVAAFFCFGILPIDSVYWLDRRRRRLLSLFSTHRRPPFLIYGLGRLWSPLPLL